MMAEAMNPVPNAKRVSSGRYSGWRLFLEGLTGQRGWSRSRYRVVIVGGGGHGLATAFYLATEYGITDVAVLEKGPIGLGNVGRNTTTIRSNYFHPDNIRFYEYSLKLWEGLERKLNFNAMVSQRGVLNLFHTDAQRDLFTRRANAMCLLGAGPSRPIRSASQSPGIRRDSLRWRDLRCRSRATCCRPS
jgi:sarcosine oxidase subunit beta